MTNKTINYQNEKFIKELSKLLPNDFEIIYSATITQRNGSPARKVGIWVKHKEKKMFISIATNKHDTLDTLPIHTDIPILDEDLFNTVIDRKSWISPISELYAIYQPIYKKILKERARAKKITYYEAIKLVEKKLDTFRPFRPPTIW